MKIKKITTRILSIALLIIILLAAELVFVMNYSLHSLTDTIMLSILQPLAKTAAKSVEGNMRALTSHFFLIRENNILSSSSASIDDKQTVLEKASSSIEFVWLGIYEEDGTLLTGNSECPRSISGRKLYPLLLETDNLVIEDTSVGDSGLEIVMGLPMRESDPKTGNRTGTTYYLAGSYEYDVLSDVLGNINIGTNSTAFIINEKGTLIAHKDLGKIFSGESATRGIGEEVTLRMIQGQTGSLDVKRDEGQIFVSFSPIRGTLWSLGIRALRSDFMSAASQAVFMSIFIVVFALIFFTLILNFSIRKILSVPLSAITESARQLALGQSENRLPRHLTERDDEIGQLSAAFATMSNSIHGVIQDIERLTQAARAGSLGERADHSIYHGDYDRIISGINAALDMVCSHFDVMPDALTLFNGEQKPVYMNQAMKNLLECHSLQVNIVNPLARIVSSGSSDKLTPEISALFAATGEDKNTYEGDVTLTDKNGAICNYALILRRIGGEAEADLSEDAVCLMLILKNVTLLTKAKNEAETASRAKGDFLSRMSHEMRTPMNAIIGMAAIGQASADIERKEYCLNKISEASRHLLGVINDILDMSKIEAGKLELSSGEFNFEEMLQRVASVINFRVEEKRQNFFIEIDRNIPAGIITDEQRLAQVITNLLANAVKFTPENGSITLKAAKISQDDENCVIRLEVKDTGIGISPEQQKRLFASFEQADGSISRKFGGTGLGLAISKRIIELMEGKIWVESVIDGGASFIFEIKVAVGKEERRDTLRPEINGDNLRVLVVDDSPEILDFFTTMLEPYNIHPGTASGGAEALRLLENALQPYSLIFVDWRMPEMNGLDLTREIMSRPGPKPEIILITAADWSDVEKEARSAGVSRFLQKPLFPHLLLNCINGSANQTGQTKQSELEDASENGIFAGSRILLAEDVDINREIAQSLLEHTGLDIDFAEDGQQAVEKFSASPRAYTLILMDVHMPNVDGYEATRRIRSSGLPGAEDIPIIAITADVFREDIELCLAAGMNGHLGKPINAAEVIATLRRYLPSASPT
jgi:signal transduction histidine kinase/DNA-binding response OmpR family regulator